MNSNKIINIMVHLVTEIIVAIIWSTIMFLVIKDNANEDIFWIGYGFGMLAFVLTALYSALIGERVNRNVSDIRFIQYYFSMWFLVISVLYNTVAVFSDAEKAARNMVIWNLIFIAGFFLTVLYISSYIARVTALTTNVTNRMQNSINVSAKLGGLVAVATNPEIRDRLLKLKQNVDYSSNMTQASSYEVEMQFGAALDEIQGLMFNGTDTETIIKKIDGATSLWFLRNNNAASFR